MRLFKKYGKVGRSNTSMLEYVFLDILKNIIFITYSFLTKNKL